MNPPEDDGGRPPPGEPAHAKQVATTTTSPPAAIKASRRLDCNCVPRQCWPEAWVWRRRLEASRRLPPLDCGCRDSWPCRCTRPLLSEKMIDAGSDAALHILIATSCVPILRPDTLHALHRRGGDDRQLVQQLYALAGGDAA